MNTKFHRALLFSLLLCLLGVPVLAQSVTSVTFQNRDLEDQETMNGKMHFTANVLRIDGEQDRQSGSFSLIFRGDRQLIWFLQHDERKYIEMDQETLDQMSTQISGVLAQMEEQLKNLPPEQRERVRQMMKGRMPDMEEAQPSAPPEIRATGESREISGYACRHYDVFQDGSKVAEVWATSQSNVAGAENLSSVFEQLAEFYKNLTRNFAQFQTGFDFNVLADLDGFPIQMQNFEDGQLKSEMLIQEIVETTDSGTLFEKPVGYQEQKMSFPR